MFLTKLINKSMKRKYTPKIKGTKIAGDGRYGRYVDPNSWIMGPDPLTREKYYAWLKHRSQAWHRNEDYELTWEDWQSLWTDELFHKRGRSSTDLCLNRVDLNSSWNLNNCVVFSRREHFEMKKQRNADARS
jgi:hypothetical protein